MKQEGNNYATQTFNCTCCLPHCEKKVYDTGCSQAVTVPSTNPSQQCLTWQIGRDAVLSLWYGRRH